MFVTCPFCDLPFWSNRRSPARPSISPKASLLLTCPHCRALFQPQGKIERPGKRAAVFGGYRMVERLDTGALGTLYRGRRPGDSTDVAIRIPPLIGSREKASELMKIQKGLIILRDPAIVPARKVSQDEGVPFIVSDYVQDPTLADYLQQRESRMKDALSVVAQICTVCNKAHAAGVLHGHLHSGNVFIPRNVKIKIADFGVASPIRKELGPAIEKAFLRAPAYRAPEQLKLVKGPWTVKSDVFAVGTILYEVLAGEPPFQGTPAQVVDQIDSHSPPPPSSVNPEAPRSLDTITLRCLAREPNGEISADQS